MPSETHRRLLLEGRVQNYLNGTIDPDGPPQPMRPATVWQGEGERRAERIYREARDAALIAALRFT